MNDFTRLIASLKRDQKRTGTDYTGTVTRVDGGTAYVRLTGSQISDTPCALTISAKAGDRVRVRVSGGKAWLTGNDTAPPSNDKKEVARKMNSDMSGRKKHITIKDGTIKFVGKTLVVESENFRLDEDGNAVFGGKLDAAGGTFAGEVVVRLEDDADTTLDQMLMLGASVADPIYIEYTDKDEHDENIHVGADGVVLAKNEGRIWTQVTHEGFNTSERTASQQGLGIYSGVTESFSVAANTYSDYVIRFPMAFSQPPAVIVTPTAGSTVAALGNMLCVVESRSYTEATIRIYNNNSSARYIGLHWIAIGQ